MITHDPEPQAPPPSPSRRPRKPKAEQANAKPRGKTTTPGVQGLTQSRRLLAAHDERAYLVELHDQLLVAYARALKANSFVAASKLVAQALEMKRAILALDEKAKTDASAPATEHELVQLLTDRLAQLPTPYLEIAVAEYLRRFPGVRLTTDG